MRRKTTVRTFSRFTRGGILRGGVLTGKAVRSLTRDHLGLLDVFASFGGDNSGADIFDYVVHG